NDVLVEEPAFLEKTNRRFRGKFIGAEFANADQVAQPLSLLGFRKLEKRIESVHFAFCRRLAVLRQRLKLSFHEFAQSAILKAVNDWTCPQKRKKENAAPRHNAAGFIDLAEQRCFFDCWETQRERTNR